MCLPIKIISSWEAASTHSHQSMKAFLRAEHRRLTSLPFLHPAPSNAELVRRRLQYQQTVAAARNTVHIFPAAPVNPHLLTAAAAAVQAQQQRLQVLAGWHHWTQQVNLARAQAAQTPTPTIPLVIQKVEQQPRQE